MSRRRETYKKMHPEQFSDSKIVQKGKLDRDFLDFYFETLTSKNLDKPFEEFCRHIAEVEICPNLLPQTGPTGGGDSKVDSETYPVSENLSALWYFGNGNKAATERWAFAISAKKDWKPKVKSDVAKIVKANQDKNRGYTKIFFLSNQYISDKKRADTEDELRKEYNLDIRIIDRTWLLDKALKDEKNIAITIEAFGLSSSFANEVQIGSRDFQRKKELESIEDAFRTEKLKPSEMISFSQKSLILARELEFPKQQILGIIDRNNRITNEYGSKLNIADAIYDAAWTIFWWYDDTNLFYQYYTEYEKLALKEDNVYLFSNLVTLWINLFSLSLENTDISIDEHTKLLKEKYVQFISDPLKPNTAIEAKASYQLMRIFLGDTLDDIVDEIIQILDDSFGHLDLDLYPLCKAIQDSPIFEEAKHFDDLFERVVSLMSEQKRKSEVGLMLAKRGHALKDKKPYEALSYFSRALMNLYSENNKTHLITVIMEMGNIFENSGLLWAARNFYLYDFCLCLHQYIKFGEVFPLMAMGAHELKYIELKLGHMLYSTTFNYLEKVAAHIYPSKINVDVNSENYDYILAIQILRTSYEVEKRLEKLPSYLEKHGLVFASAAMKYELGYYDDSILNALNGDEDAFEDMIEKWVSQPAADQLRYLPWYGNEDSCKMQTNLLGCTIEVNINDEYSHGEIEIAATILATLESFWGTGVAHELISFSGKISIELRFDTSYDSFINGKIDENRPNAIIVTFKNYNPDDIVTVQQEFSDFLIEIIGMVSAIMFPLDTALEKIEQMIKNEGALDRSQTFANSVFLGLDTLGKETFCYNFLVHDLDKLGMKRSQKSSRTNKKVPDAVEPIIPGVHQEKLPDSVDFKNVSNENIVTSAVINIPLWNVCGWKGILFMATRFHECPPVLSLAFTSVSCKIIFEDWIRDIGTVDAYDKISIRIIKGIDRYHPYWYRVVVGQSNFPYSQTKNAQIIAMPVRMHTMQPNSDANLKLFERELQIFKCFSMCPSYFKDIAAQPQIFEELMIRKKYSSIKICDACDVSENDWLAESGLLPTDEPIIPTGKENAPILSMIQRKRQK